MSGRLAGRVAAITGSSRGIGRAVATAFLAEGAKVAVNSRDQAVADQVARELGARAVGIGADVATEAGAAALVEGAVDAFGRLDVLVNAVAPGYVRTSMTEKLQAEGRIDFDAISRRTPQRRLAEPDELAGAYTFLASAEASFVTGETIVVDGGWLAFGAFEGI